VINFRNGHCGLAVLMQPMCGLDPPSDATIVFFSKQAGRIKILIWEENSCKACDETTAAKVVAEFLAHWRLFSPLICVNAGRAKRRHPTFMVKTERPQ
jgi:hypothetical protein